jgi:hypothetical protein
MKRLATHPKYLNFEQMPNFMLKLRLVIIWQHTRSQSYQTLISSFFQFLLLSLAISKYRQYFLMLQTLKLNNEKWKKSSFYEEKSLVGLTPDEIRDTQMCRDTMVENH